MHKVTMKLKDRFVMDKFMFILYDVRTICYDARWQKYDEIM